MRLNYPRLSKTIAHALRHDPERYGLELDEEGWTPVENLLAALRAKRREWKNLNEEHLHTMMQQAEKRRYEIRDGRIRAYYGHTIPQRIQKTPAEPPHILYHGTSPRVAEIVTTEGLRPMKRQYVHLATTEDTAIRVGSRHTRTPVLLQVSALDAHRTGLNFYPGHEDIWLADAIPPEFVTLASPKPR